MWQTCGVRVTKPGHQTPHKIRCTKHTQKSKKAKTGFCLVHECLTGLHFYLLLVQVNVFCMGTKIATSLDPIDRYIYIYRYHIYLSIHQSIHLSILIYTEDYWRVSPCFLFFGVTSTKGKGSAFAFCLGFRALKCLKHRCVHYFTMIFIQRITPQSEYCSLDWPIRGQKSQWNWPVTTCDSQTTRISGFFLGFSLAAMGQDSRPNRRFGCDSSVFLLGFSIWLTSSDLSSGLFLCSWFLWVTLLNPERILVIIFSWCIWKQGNPHFHT